MAANLKSVFLSKGLDLGTVYQPYGLVGGDVLHALELAPGRFSLFIADVSGKGVPAAVVGAAITEFILGPAKAISSPKEAMLCLNDTLVGKIPDAMFATAMYAVVDAEKKTITTVNCGHNPILIFRSTKKTVEEFDVPGTVLGRVSRDMLAQALQETTYTLEPLDRFMMYTDGLSEAMNPAEVEYGKERMKATFGKAARLSSEEFLIYLTRDLEDFQSGTPIGDDLTIVTIRFSSDVATGATPRPQPTPVVPPAPLVEHTPMPIRADTVTGLPDASGMSRPPKDKAYSVVTFDLDRFSEINAQFGAAQADDALRRIGEDLKTQLEGIGTVGRLAGDEFYALVPGSRGSDAADEILKKVAAVKLPFPNFHLSASAGIAQFPESGTTTEKVLRQARLNMDLSKQAGGNRLTAAGGFDPLQAITLVATRELARPVFTGRNEELTLIEQTLDEARRGRSRLIVVTGERGGGKSRLLEEAGRLSEGRKMLVLWIACRNDDIERPYGLIHRILSSLAQMYPTRVKSILESIPTECFHILKQVFPDLTSGLDRPAPAEASPDRHRLIFVTLSRMLQGWARAKGMCLLIERGGACDRASLELLRWMLTSPGLRSTTFMEVSRDAMSSEGFFASALTEFLKDLRFTGSVWEMDLPYNALSGRDLQWYVRHNLLSVQPWDVFSTRLNELTQGEPYKVLVWLKQQISHNAIRAAPLAWKIEEDRLVPPKAFSREDVSDADSRELLDIASVFGAILEPDHLAKALGWNPGRFDDVVERLISQSVLRRPLYSKKLAFLTESVCDSWYDELSDGTRKSLHAKAGRIMEESSNYHSALYHYSRAGDSEKAQAARTEAARRGEDLFDEKKLQALRNLKASDEMVVIPDCKEPLSEASQEAVLSMVRKLSNAIKLIRLYPKGSPALEQAQALFIEECETTLQPVVGITLSVETKGLSLNMMTPKELAAGTAEESLLMLLKEKLIKSATILKGAAKEELIGLAQLLAERTDPYEIAARDDYWQWRADQASLIRIGISPVAYVADSGEVSELVDDARTLKEIGSSIREFLQALVGGAEAARVYPRGSGVIQENVLTLHRSLTVLMKHVPGLSLAVIEKDLAINGTPADATKYTHIVDEVAKFLLEREIRSISFTGEVEPKELDVLMDVLGRSHAKGEEAVAQLLDQAQVHSIAVGANAFRYKEFGVSTGAKVDRGPVEKVLSWLESDDAFLIQKESLDQLIQTLNAVGAAKRPDLGCRLIKRYVAMLKTGDPAQRLAAAQAITESILRCSAMVRKVIVAAVQDTITALLSTESPGPVFDALAPLSLRVIQESIAKENWELVQSTLTSLYQREAAKPMVDEALNLFERDHQLDPLYKAFESASSRLQIEPILLLLGQRIIRPIALIMQRSEDSKTRNAAALLLRKIDPEIWKKVLRGFSSNTASFECLNVIEALPLLMDDFSQAGSTLSRLADHTDEKVVNRLLDLAEPLGYASADEIVSKVLWRADEKLLLRALQVGARLKLKNSAPKILDMLKREQSEKLSIACCEYFQQVPMTIAQELLVKIATSKKGFLGMQYEFAADVRAAAVLALGSYKNPEADGALKKAREDKSAAVRAAARYALEGPSDKSEKVP